MPLIPQQNLCQYNCVIKLKPAVGIDRHKVHALDDLDWASEYNILIFNEFYLESQLLYAIHLSHFQVMIVVRNIHQMPPG